MGFLWQWNHEKETVEKLKAVIIEKKLKITRRMAVIVLVMLISKMKNLTKLICKIYSIFQEKTTWKMFHKLMILITIIKF